MKADRPLLLLLRRADGSTIVCCFVAQRGMSRLRVFDNFHENKKGIGFDRAYPLL